MNGVRATFARPETTLPARPPSGRRRAHRCPPLTGLRSPRNCPTNPITPPTCEVLLEHGRLLPASHLRRAYDTAREDGHGRHARRCPTAGPERQVARAAPAAPRRRRLHAQRPGRLGSHQAGRETQARSVPRPVQQPDERHE
ncbi:conserved hypothetical protein [Streptomyces misionensis JCM 4497]